MKLVQFFLPGKGKRVGVVRGDRVFDITRAGEGVGSTLELIRQGGTAAGLGKRVEWLARAGRRPGLDYRDLQRPPSRRSPHLLAPIEPPEVWVARAGGGERSAPALFLKATASRCAGPHAGLARRRGSKLTVPHPGVGLVLGSTEVVAFTAYLGLTAQDLLDGPLSLSLAETYDGCCALGPCLVTADEFGGAERLQVRLALQRGGRDELDAAFPSPALAEIPRTVPRLVTQNPCPPGTLLALEAPIPGHPAPTVAAGDRLIVEIQAIGRLTSLLGQE
jgi:fumarylacetoacetate (FAA) hydrolase family protein